MRQEETSHTLDRHALVMAVWCPIGLVAVALFHYGFVTGLLLWLAGGFAAVLAGFLSHVIINAVFRTSFSAREAGLALVISLAALLAFVLSTLLVDGFAAAFFLPVIGGIAVLVAAVIFYMVTSFGTRGAFNRFDIVRDNNPRRSSQLIHRGGRK